MPFFLDSGKSLERGAVQLYRDLGIRDEQIMEIFQIHDANVYSKYCAAYKDCAPNDFARFTNVSALLKDAETIDCEEAKREPKN